MTAVIGEHRPEAKQGEAGGQLMQTRRRDLRGPAVVGSLAALGGAAVRRLGIEFERAWLRSYEGPLLDETLPVDNGGTAQRAPDGQAGGEQRRWVAEHHPRGVPGTASVARPDRG
jgi:hypothetical protein